MPKKEEKHNFWCCCRGCGGSKTFGIMILVVGLYFLAKDLGWISSNLSFWPVLLVALGVYILIRKNR